MRHRTCILVTHAVDLCLPGSAYVVSMDNGSIITSGSPDTLAAPSSSDALAKGEDVAAASAITIEAIASGETDDEVTAEQAEAKRARQEKLKLVKDETMSEGELVFDLRAKISTDSRDTNRIRLQGRLLALPACHGWLVARGRLARHLRRCAGVRDRCVFLSTRCRRGTDGRYEGVSLALRYWAASYDDQENSAGQLVAQTLHTSLNRWRAVPSLVLHPLRSTGLDAAMDAGNDTTDYWLKMYVVLGVINLVSLLCPSAPRVRTEMAVAGAVRRKGRVLPPPRSHCVQGAVQGPHRQDPGREESVPPC